MRRPGQPKVSAGILLYRRSPAGEIEVLLAHPGGPFFTRKDNGHWTIPKGQPDPGEELIHAAQREFFEEVGFVPVGPFVELGQIQQKGGKIVHGWAAEGDFPPGYKHTCITFKTEWPPGSGTICTFPEIDRVEFLSLPKARLKLKETQWPFLDRLAELIEGSASF